MNKKSLTKALAISTLALSAGLASTAAMADMYSVTVTNVTLGQAFTPRLAITHTAGKVFTLGEAALPELIDIAEGGNVAPLMELLGGLGNLVTDMQVGDGLLMPGTSQTFMIDGNPGSSFTLLSMLIPTNDAFFAINGATLPESGSVSWKAMVYDAGSETNDEVCSNIPGPVCGGTPGSPDDEGEGYVFVHPGIKGIADLDVATYDWNNPAAIVTVTKQ